MIVEMQVNRAVRLMLVCDCFESHKTLPRREMFWAKNDQMAHKL